MSDYLVEGTTEALVIYGLIEHLVGKVWSQVRQNNVIKDPSTPLFVHLGLTLAVGYISNLKIESILDIIRESEIHLRVHFSPEVELFWP